MATILFADDERDFRDLVAFTFRFAGYDVFTACNGEEALNMAQQLKPNLILMDVRMPRMTGYEACRLLKQDLNLKDIPVVFLSAKGQESEIQQGFDAGAEEYLLKPVAPDQLTNSIKRIMRKSSLGIYDE